MTPSAIISPFLTLPLASVLMVVIAIHIEHTLEHTSPRSRKRLRMANGWVMLLVVPLLATGSSLVNADTHPRLFALVWTTAILFLMLALLLACADVLNTLRLTIRSRTTLKHQLHADLLHTALTQSRQNTDTADNQPNDQHESPPA